MLGEYSREYHDAKLRYEAMVKDFVEYIGCIDELKTIQEVLESGVTILLSKKLDEKEREYLNEHKAYFEERKAELENTVPEKYGVQTPEELETKIQAFKLEVDRLGQLARLERRQHISDRSREKKGKRPERRGGTRPVRHNDGDR